MYYRVMTPHYLLYNFDNVVQQLQEYIVSMQGIIDMNRNGNSANFFSYVRNDKKSKELFASFLNRILSSVICVSSVKFVFSA